MSQFDEVDTGYAYKQEDMQWLFDQALPMTFSTDDVDLRQVLDPRPWLKIENQSSMGSCQGHALTTGLEVIYNQASGGQIIQLARIYAYLESQRLDGLLGSDRGSTMSGGAKLAFESGIPLESAFPYPNPVRYPRVSDWNRKINRWKANPTKTFKIQTRTKIQSFDEACAWLAGRAGTLHIGMWWGLQLNSKAVATSYVAGRGMHAVEGVTIDVDRYKEPTICIANSHGTRYGVDGYFYMTKRAFEQMLSRQHCVCIGLSDMETPRPRQYKFADEPLLA